MDAPEAVEIVVPREGRYRLVQSSDGTTENQTVEQAFIAALGEEFLTIGSLIRHFRERSAMTLRDLAGRTGIDHAQISRYENNDKKPSSDSIASLERVLGEDFSKALKLAAIIGNR